MESVRYHGFDAGGNNNSHSRIFKCNHNSVAEPSAPLHGVFYTFLKSRLEPPRKINGKKEKKHLPERTFVRRQGNKKKKDKTNVETKPAFLDLKVQDCGHCLGASTGTGLKRSWIERASSRARRWSSVN